MAFETVFQQLHEGSITVQKTSEFSLHHKTYLNQINDIAAFLI